MEKIHTDIFASMAEGASHVADGIEAGIKAAQHEGKFYVMALGTGSSLNAVYNELIRRYEKKALSFRNVVISMLTSIILCRKIAPFALSTS